MPGSDDRPDLRRELADLTRIVDAIPAFVFYKDTHNRVLRVNRAVADSLGVTPEEMVDTPTERWYPDEAAAYYADDKIVIESGKPKLGIVELLELKGGAKRWIVTDKLPQVDDSGTVTGIVVIAQDITDRVQMEQQLREVHKLDSIGRLAGGVAHDFNNLLTAILGHLSMARLRLPEDSPITEDLDAVKIAVERGADLTRQLLGFARKQRVEPKIVDLRETLRQSELLLRRVIDEHIRVAVSSTAEVCPVEVDPSQITQVVLNLAINARDAMPNGGTLTLRIDHTDPQTKRPWPAAIAPGRYVLLTVRDTGAGMSAEARQHVFEPFFTTKDVGRGTGLGLATSYGIVKQNRGHILLADDDGAGTTFEIYLPLAIAPVPPAALPVPVLPTQGRTATILLVEDDASLRAIAATILANAGHRVLQAEDGQAGLRMAARHFADIDLVVTDVVMPNLGGPDMVASLRDAGRRFQVLYMSGYARDSALGGDNLLPKPFTPETLRETVATILAKR